MSKRYEYCLVYNDDAPTTDHTCRVTYTEQTAVNYPTPSHWPMAFCNTDPPSTPSNPSVSLEDGLPVADRTANPDPNNPAETNASNGATEPVDFSYRELSLSETCWPADLVLDTEKDNWPDWSRSFTLLAGRLGFSRWLDGSRTCYDPAAYPNAHRTWKTNDRAVRAVILERVSETDYSLVSHLQDTHAVFEELRKRHERGSIYSQMLLLLKLSDMQFEPATPMSETVCEMKRLFARIVKMGRIDDDRLLAFLAMHALGEQSRHLPSSIQAKINVPGNSSTALFQYIDAEESKHRYRLKRGAVQPSTHPPPTSAAPIVVINGVSYIPTRGGGAR